MAVSRVMGFGVVVALFVAVTVAGVSAQADCTTAYNSLLPCYPYVTGPDTAPPATCCMSLSALNGQNPVCLCQVIEQLNSTANVNVTKAYALPANCGITINTQTCPGLADVPGTPTSSGPTAAPPVATPPPVVAPVASPTTLPTPSAATPTTVTPPSTPPTTVPTAPPSTSPTTAPGTAPSATTPSPSSLTSPPSPPAAGPGSSPVAGGPGSSPFGPGEGPTQTIAGSGPAPSGSTSAASAIRPAGVSWMVLSSVVLVGAVLRML